MSASVALQSARLTPKSPFSHLNNMSQVLFLTHRFWPSLGGTQTLAHEVAKRLVKRGYAVTVFTSAIDSNNLEEWKDGIRIQRFPRRNIVLARPWYVTPGMVNSAVWSEFNILHSFHFITFQSLLAATVRRATRVPFIMTPSFHPWHGLYEDTVGTWVMRSADGVIAQCEQERRNLLCYLDERRMATIPCGIDSSRFRHLPEADDFRRKYGIDSRDKLILYVGYLSRHKGVPDLLHSMPKVLEKVPNAKLVLVGRGPAEEAARQGSELGLSKALKVLGNLSDAELLEAYASADAFALLSHDESFGIVLVEAAAAGIPIVSTRVGVAEELILDGVTGYVGDFSRDEFASRISETLCTESFRVNSEKRRDSIMQSFDWETVTTSIENVYRHHTR